MENGLKNGQPQKCGNCTTDRCRIAVNPKWIANLDDECDVCSKKGMHNHIMEGTYHISPESIEEDECPFCGCEKPKITNVKWDPHWKTKMQREWCPYEVNHFEKNGICNLCGRPKSEHVTKREYNKVD